MLNTITTVVAALLGIHALVKFVFFALPYRKRRAALDKSYGGKASATTTSDRVLLGFAIALAAVFLWRGIDAVSSWAASGSGHVDPALLPRVPCAGRA